LSCLLFSLTPPPPPPTLFPYTTLFRSSSARRAFRSASPARPSRGRPRRPEVPPARASQHRLDGALIGLLDSRASTCGRRLAACRSEEHTSELQSQSNLVCRLLLEKKKK